MARSPAATDVFAAVASPIRRLLLDRLSSREQTVRRLASPFRMTLAAVSQHLQILRAAGLVSARRVGRYQVYHLHADRLRDIAAWTQKYERFWTASHPPKTPVEPTFEPPVHRPVAEGEWRAE
jgi:DNA-binding transcriptional ArsR family regulator